MIFAVSSTDAAILAAVVIVIAILIYRVVRREPTARLVRLGIFLERQRYADNGEQVTERHEWPRQKEEDL